MPKKVSPQEKELIKSAFIDGLSIPELSDKFKVSKVTITRYLKKEITESKYKEILKKNKIMKKNTFFKKEINPISETYDVEPELKNKDLRNSNFSYSDQSFFEITPLNYEIDNVPQKDLSSVPIAEVVFPKIVYMIVDKKIELETKYLQEYPEWQFLSQEELNRKTIQIYFDLKVAKRCCQKEQKVIKVPNTEVFRIATPSLLQKGISRIVTEDKLIAL